MQIIVIGAGSIGTVIGILLNEVGHDVILLRRGGNFGEYHIKMTGVHSMTSRILVKDINERYMENVDIFILCTQRQQSRDALQLISKNYRVTDESIFICLQNGLGVSDTVISIFPEVRIVQGVIWWSATLLNYDKVYYHRKASTFIGQTHGKDVVEEIYNLLKAVIEVVKTENIEKEVRKKLILNVVSPVLALVKKPYPEGLNSINTRKIVHILFDEALFVANKFGWDVNDQILDDFHQLLASEHPIKSGEESYPVHKVSTQISAEKHGGMGSNGRELLLFFIENGAKGCEIVLDTLSIMLPNHKALSPDNIENLLDKIMNFDTRCLIN